MRTCAFVAFDGLQLLDLAGPVEVLRTATLLGAQPGYRTLVATPHGGVFVNPTGNPGMATAGSGDVLTGLIASLLGQKHHPLAACLLATWLHGRAGDLAAARLGEEPLMAGDLLTCYPEALRELREGGA